MGAIVVDEPGHALDAPNGLTGASFYLDEASVTGTETALACGRRRERENRNQARGDGAARRRAVQISQGDGRFDRRRRDDDDPRRGAGAVWRARRTASKGDYIEAGSWGVTAAITGGDIEVIGVRTSDLEVVAAPLSKMGLQCRYENDRLIVRALNAYRRRPNHHRTLARVSERHGQPGHRARDPGRRPDARA